MIGAAAERLSRSITEPTALSAVMGKRGPAEILHAAVRLGRSSTLWRASDPSRATWQPRPHPTAGEHAQTDRNRGLFGSTPRTETHGEQHYGQPVRSSEHPEECVLRALR